MIIEARDTLFYNEAKKRALEGLIEAKANV